MDYCNNVVLTLVRRSEQLLTEASYVKPTARMPCEALSRGLLSPYFDATIEIT